MQGKLERIMEQHEENTDNMKRILADINTIISQIGLSRMVGSKITEELVNFAPALNPQPIVTKTPEK